jgi:hypothetical protein
MMTFILFMIYFADVAIYAQAGEMDIDDGRFLPGPHVFIEGN